MRRARVALALVLLAARAAAQPAPCPVCARGDALVEHFSLQPMRAIAGELSDITLGDPLTAEQYARLVDMRRKTPVLARLGAIDDEDLAAIAIALCRSDKPACVVVTTRALQCLADRCAIDLPRPDPHRVDVIAQPAECHQYSTHKRSPPFGLGFDWGTGWQRSRFPSDGGAWSLGIEGRMQLGRYLGAVARVDRVSGRDEATDANHDGIDDFSTGSITRISALAGPSIVLDNTRYEDTTRFVRLDLLGGYLATRSQPGESGPAAGFDLAYQLSIIRVGVRFVQGFADASDATMLLAHFGLISGSVPAYDSDTDCGAQAAARATRLAIGFDFPLGGYGISSELGYLAPGLGLEASWHLTKSLDATSHADLLDYPGYNRDRVLHQAVLAGVRIDHGHKSSGTGFFTTVMGGYSHGIGLTPTSVGSGPIAELSFAWGGQGAEAAGWLRLHARFGVGPDNLDYRAVFLSAGFELRLDPHSWRDRD